MKSPHLDRDDRINLRNATAVPLGPTKEGPSASRERDPSPSPELHASASRTNTRAHEPAEPRLLSAQDAARYLGVPYTSLRDWALAGHLPIVRAPGCRRLWFDRRDLDRAIDAWKERGIG